VLICIIFKNVKLSEVIGNLRWIIWVNQESYLDQHHLVHISPINLFPIFFLLEMSEIGVILRTEGRKLAEDFENLLMLVVWIDLVQQYM
jgi:predicted glycoside hydrolase/deacetylase ChbG (UPF0249 family)